jgi:hypothetical protein
LEAGNKEGTAYDGKRSRPSDSDGAEGKLRWDPARPELVEAAVVQGNCSD